MTLTPDQQYALSDFRKFLNSDKQVFMLKGSAGSGKTTLLKILISDNNFPCKLLAPTGRAAHILKEKTGREASTIHRAIYCLDTIDESKDDKKFFALRNNDDSSNCIYFIDEASMVSDLFSDNDIFRFGSGILLQDLLSYCGSRKIVFIGDYAQLPPVGQNVSPALDADYLLKKYNITAQEVFLRQVVRQVENSGIYINATKIRDSIEKNLYNEFSIENCDCVFSSNSIVDDYITETGGKVDENSIIITYKNKDALKYNIEIRDRLFASKQKLNSGDLLIISQNNYSYQTELFNGTIVKVVDCEDDEHLERRTVSFRTSNKDENGNQAISVELCFRNVVIQTSDDEKADTLKVKILDNFLTDDSSGVTKTIIQALNADFHNRIPYKEQPQKRQHDPYLNALLCKYGYAITCHKAQGGEWKNVFVDMNRIGTKNKDYFRWTYTAITRSNSKLWHYASPDYNIISDMLVKPVTKGGDFVFYIPEKEDPLEWRYEKIKGLCDANNICCSDDRTKQYQHLFLFSKSNESCKVQLWYGKNSYNGKVSVMKKNSDNFANQMLNICEDSIIPDVSVFTNENGSAVKLQEYIIDITKELGIVIFNIIRKNYNDIYYLKTDSLSVVSFCYNGKGFYTYMQPQSIDGSNDALLNLFCEKFK